MNLDQFDAALREAQDKRSDAPDTKINCDTIHPIVAEYLIETMEQIASAEKDVEPSEAIGINSIVSQLTRQIAACLTEEIFGLFDEVLEEAADLAVDVLLELPSDEDSDIGLPEDYNDSRDIPIMMSMDALEIIVKTALKIGYLVIPEVEKHFE